MRLALITDAYPPARTSAAVQMRDLAAALAGLGHEVTVIVPGEQRQAATIERGADAIEVVRFPAPRTKDVGHLRRFAAEWAMPWCGIRAMRGHGGRFDGVVWYSPSIFHGALIRWIKSRNACRSYLILRDLFPQWAIDTGVLSEGPAAWFLRQIERRQYDAADTIGVQARSAIEHVGRVARRFRDRCEVLENWLAPPLADQPDQRDVDAFFATRSVFVYAGNMGVAQGAAALIDLAASVRERSDLGFYFVGRGSEAACLRESAVQRGLSNVRFSEEVPPDQVPRVLAQCHVGMVALDPRHTTDNIPGKFLAYMRSGLPVLACINEGNELGGLIRQANVGEVWHPKAPLSLTATALQLASRLRAGEPFAQRCRALAEARYCPSRAAQQIVEALRR